MALQHSLLDEILELADLTRPAWGEIKAGIPAWHPRNEGDADADGSGDGADGDADADGQGAGDAGSGDAGTGGDVDWKAMARKHEREAKKARKALDEREAALKEREDAEKSEHEKAIEKARAEAKNEALAEAEKERRNDRLEVAVTRLSARSFADTEDALLHVQRGITAGDIDPDDIFDSEGKVQTDALTKALDELLERKPHLKGGPGGRPAGDADAGKGAGAAKGLEDMSVEDHARRKYGTHA